MVDQGGSGDSSDDEMDEEVSEINEEGDRWEGGDSTQLNISRSRAGSQLLPSSSNPLTPNSSSSSISSESNTPSSSTINEDEPTSSTSTTQLKLNLKGRRTRKSVVGLQPFDLAQSSSSASNNPSNTEDSHVRGRSASKLGEVQLLDVNTSISQLNSKEEEEELSLQDIAKNRKSVKKKKKKKKKKAKKRKKRGDSELGIDELTHLVRKQALDLYQEFSEKSKFRQNFHMPEEPNEELYIENSFFPSLLLSKLPMMRDVRQLIEEEEIEEIKRQLRAENEDLDFDEFEEKEGSDEEGDETKRRRRMSARRSSRIDPLQALKLKQLDENRLCWSNRRDKFRTTPVRKELGKKVTIGRMDRLRDDPLLSYHPTS